MFDIQIGDTIHLKPQVVLYSPDQNGILQTDTNSFKTDQIDRVEPREFKPGDEVIIHTDGMHRRHFVRYINYKIGQAVVERDHHLCETLRIVPIHTLQRNKP